MSQQKTSFSLRFWRFTGFVLMVIDCFSVHRKCPQCNHDVMVETPHIVRCNESRPFWIRWFQGVEVSGGCRVFEGGRGFMSPPYL